MAGEINALSPAEREKAEQMRQDALGWIKDELGKRPTSIYSDQWGQSTNA
jgi:hypothetical protein